MPPSKRVHWQPTDDVDCDRLQRVVESCSWQDLVVAVVQGRDQLHSLSPARERIQDIIQLISTNEKSTNTYKSTDPHRRALLSLHLAIDCSKEYPKFKSAEHLANMLQLYARVGVCRTFVNLKNWLINDGPALAHAYFEPVLLATGPPLTLGVPWLDELAGQLHMAVSSYVKARDEEARKTARTRPTAQKAGPTRPTTTRRLPKTVEKEIEVLDNTADVLFTGEWLHKMILHALMVKFALRC